MLWPSDIAVVDRGLATLPKTCGDQEVATRLTEGRAMLLADAIAVATTLSRPPAKAMAAGSSPETLTRREEDVLRLLAEQRTDREIAEALFLSRRTVNWHVRSILAKLDAATRGDAVVRARAVGLV